MHVIALLDNPAIAAAVTVLLAGVFDLLLGEPPTPVHPVAWIGGLIGALERRRPMGRPRAELAYGVLIVVVVCAVAGGAAWGIAWGLGHLPAWAGVLVGAYVLKTTFSLRGLAGAGRTVQRALEADTDAAREELKALVSRSRNLEPPQIVSATVESLAENLTDSVLAPLLAFALFGLPGAAVYRAINTMDAMIGYHGEYEYVGKVAARVDDVANWLPARLAGVLLCLVAGLTGRRGATTTLVRDRTGLESPNAAWTMAPMAGALRVQLEKVGHYRLGQPERALTPAIITEAIALTWAAGWVYVLLSAGAAWWCRGRFW
jgi:adenosylcobinamide-phosphate synthase